MCVNPTYRPVKFRGINPFCQTTHLTFKCGHCAECSADRKRDYMIRNYVETAYTLAQGGICLVDTLTYNDFHVPFILVESSAVFTPEEQQHLIKARHYDVERWNSLHPKDQYKLSPNLYRVNCFNYDHVSKFFKRFRHYVCNYLREKNGYNHTQPEGKYIDDLVSGHLRYFIAPELGHDHGRPHYHLTIHSTVPDVSKLKLKALFDAAWRFLNQRGQLKTIMCNKRFSVYNLNDLGATEGYEKLDYNTIKSVSEIAHIKYSTKYVCKNSYMEQLYCKLFDVQSPSELPQCLHSGIRSSIGFGYQLVDDYLGLFQDKTSVIYLDFVKEKVYIPHSLDEGKNCVGTKSVYNLPFYYVRKLYYRRVRLSDGTYTCMLNKNGVERKIRQFTEKVKQLTQSTIEHIHSLPKSSQLAFSDLLGIRSLDELSTYRLLFFGKNFNFAQWDGSIESYYEKQNYSKLHYYATDSRAMEVYKSTKIGLFSNGEFIHDMQLHRCAEFLIRTRYLYSAWKQREYVRKHKNEIYLKKAFKIA